MSINLKSYSPFSYLIFILISQLIFSVGFIYVYHMLQPSVALQAAAVEKIGAKIQNINCDSIDKEVYLKLLESTVENTKDGAELWLSFGIFLLVSTGFSFYGLFDLRKNYAAKKPV